MCHLSGRTKYPYIKVKFQLDLKTEIYTALLELLMFSEREIRNVTSKVSGQEMETQKSSFSAMSGVTTG